MKIKFINDYQNDIIIIYKKKKDEIIQQLKENKYLLVDNDEIIDFDENIDINNKYDYLIKMPIFSLSIDKINELEKNLNELQNEFDILKNKTISDIWKEELQLFINYLDRFNY